MTSSPKHPGMNETGIVIQRHVTAINKLIAHLTVRCAIANNALEKLINADAVCIEIDDELAKDIAISDTSRIIQAIRTQVENEAKQELKIVRTNHIDAQMRAIETKINSIFAEKAEEESRNKFKLSDMYGYTCNWLEYIRYDGDKITFDAEAVEKDHITEVASNSKMAKYLKLAESLSKQMSEFIYITRMLGNNVVDAVSAYKDSVIDISNNVVTLDTRKIDWLKFDDYDKIVEDAQAKADFKRSNVNH